MALASLVALGLAIFLGFVKKMNTGLLCTALALLVGRLAGISDDEIIRGFNYSLFIMLLGVTYLFGLAEINGTLSLLSKKIVALSGRRTYLVPIVMYLFATILSARGPGTIPTAAIMMVFGMTLAKEMNINPAMLAAIISWLKWEAVPIRSNGSLRSLWSPILQVSAPYRRAARWRWRPIRQKAG